MAAAIRPARKARAYILVAKLDRLCRTLAYIAALMEHRVPFIVAELGFDVFTSGPTGPANSIGAAVLGSAAITVPVPRA